MGGENLEQESKNLQYLKGVGGKKAELYEKLGLHTVADLIVYTPRAYLDFRGELLIQQLQVGEYGGVVAQVLSKSTGVKIRQGLVLYKVKITDGEQDMTLTFFNTEYIVRSLVIGEEYLFYGKTAVEPSGLTLQNISIYPKTQQGKLQAIYPSTAGLSSKVIGKDIQTALTSCPEELVSCLPPELEQRLNLPLFKESLQDIHSPFDMDALEPAIKRMAAEELLPFCIALQLSRKEGRGKIAPIPTREMGEFWDKFPFKPTESQLKAVEEIRFDLCEKGQAMNRLLQGDVGSGKTAVAAAAAYLVAKGDAQSVMLAPTEVLAVQHYKGLLPIMEALGISVALLTGSTPAKEKREIKKAAAEGKISLLIGTHAVLTDDTLFLDLKLVITDEQHRFGVRQRSLLCSRGGNVHTLVMSATPIPRTLSLMIFGDLDLSVMESVPSGRLPIKSYLVDGGKRERAYNFMKKHLDMGYQGYLVCSRVEEDEEPTEDLKSAEKLYKELSKGSFQSYSVGLLHGKMKAKDKEKVMTAFREGEIQMLIATSVIEVGVDVPNAVLMIIENAERFGLSQLHQLRGRVGRGSVQSYCVLITDHYSPVTQERLNYLTHNHDGFEIAKADLALRGPGDFFGQRQHGLPSLPLTAKLTDSDFPQQINTFAGEFIAEENALGKMPKLAQKVQRLREELQNSIN